MEELLIDRIVEEVINRIKSLNRKKVIAIVRKDKIPFIEKLKNRNDVFCIDIDDVKNYL